MPNRNVKKIVAGIASLIFGIGLAGCGGGGSSRATRLTLIESLEIESENDRTVLVVQGNKEFEAQIFSKNNPPSMEIRIPFAVAKSLESFKKNLTLPKGGIESLGVSNLRGKYGGVSIKIRMDSPFEYSEKQTKESLRITLVRRSAPGRAADTGEKEKSEQTGEQDKTARFIVPEITNLPEKNYIIGGKDTLSIVVFEEPDLSKEKIRVSNDGYITFPLIGRIRVSGMSTDQIENVLVKKLGKDFLVNPQITVQVNEFASKVINVLGAVRNPGAVPLKGAITLLETVAQVGGVDISRAGKNIIVLRHQPGKEKNVQHITIDLNRLLKEGDLSLNISLQDKDTVFIPLADQIFVFGEVKSPGPYDLREQSVSVVEAISLAGGLTRLAAANRTRIVRVEDGEERVILVNVEKIIEGDRSKDIILQAGDIIVVPEAYF